MTPQLAFLLNQALQYLRADNLDSAELLLKQALSVLKTNSEVLRLLGVIEAKRGRNQEALAYLKNASKYDPKNGLILSNIGNVYSALKLYKEALAAHEQAISLAPSYAEAYSNKGNVLSELKLFKEALAAYGLAIQLKPDYAEAWSNSGIAFSELKIYDRAFMAYSKALEIKPDVDYLLGNFLCTKMLTVNWDNLSEYMTLLSENIQKGRKASLPFNLVGIISSPSLLLSAAQTFSEDKFTEDFSLGPIVKRSASKIRIGYYSADFHNHATAYLMAEFFELQNKNKFELTAFSFGPNTQDESRQRILKAFDQFIDVTELSDQQVARLSREMGVDIAVDLKGYTKDSRPGIFSYRAAPIQVNYLGYPGTMGSPYMDYIIADPVLIPKSSQIFYSEKITYLPNSYQVNDRSRKVSDRVFTRAECNLPDQGFVFCCFNNNYKITPATLGSWSRILKHVEGSVLWLLEDSEIAKANLIKESEALGIKQERLVFAKRLDLPEHLARHQLADLFIDTLPCNAHTTASDSLWAGLPVLTLLGEAFPGRVAASLLTAIDLPELITRSQDEYESVAIDLALNPTKIKAIKERLKENRLTKPLFNTKQITTQIESAYIQMYERYQANKMPDHIYIEPTVIE
ncbi:putative O-linked N-acetylglucosamine transferase (SPINDLY family) [Polynucleobacter sphagniphilus]|uniref:O-linked N-acetylglucosamine transferase, SPINDLY family protein n=1 Tax=Polynucleobacter sphagniphilus TaxID=1743169 RepID=UPI00247433F7|nr:tetratricopeptide repeat protein [Polynucleobacter sphagniphilus]MDH6302058.1 putative O-linked N-acetylglucosamine transferase (SPINDLY family) [Polynucleobacter sphagniphilus]